MLVTNFVYKLTYFSIDSLRFEWVFDWYTATFGLLCWQSHMLLASDAQLELILVFSSKMRTCIGVCETSCALIVAKQTIAAGLFTASFRCLMMRLFFATSSIGDHKNNCQQRWFFDAREQLTAGHFVYINTRLWMLSVKFVYVWKWACERFKYCWKFD